MIAEYISANQFRIADDHVEEFKTGRRIKANCGIDGYKYSTILSSTYSSPYTIVTIVENILTSNLEDVLYGIVNIGETGSFPEHSHDGTEGQGGIIPYVTDIELASTTSGSEGAKLVGYTDSQTVYSMIDFYANRGILTGCGVTTGSGLNISWNGGYLLDRTSGNVITIISGSGVCVDNSLNYLIWEGGTALSLGATIPTYNKLYVARIDTFAGNINLVNHVTYLNEQLANSRRAIRAMFPLIVISGLTISEKSGGGSWDVISASGEYYNDGTTLITVPALDSTVSPYITRIFHSGGIWQSDTNTAINPTQWDNGTNLVAVTANKYYKSLFIIGHSAIHWIYPQAEYNTIAQAIAAPMPTLPAGLSMHPTVTCVVLKGNDTSFPIAGDERWIDVRPKLAGSYQPATISDHGSLAGLYDDDHPQYIKHSLNVAENDFLLGGPTPFGNFIVKSLNETKTILGITTSGVQSFLDLNDTPSSYINQNGKYVKVVGNALEFATISGGISGGLSDASNLFELDENGGLMPVATISGINEVVLTAPDSSRWRLVVDNSGNLSTEAI